MSNKTTTGVKLDEATRTRLKNLGKLKDRSPHWLMKDAISRYLDNEEEVERRNQEADAAWKEYQKTGQSVSHEAMMQWFDTWGTDKEGQCPPTES